MREMLSKVVLAILNGTLRQVARRSLACPSMLAPSPSLYVQWKAFAKEYKPFYSKTSVKTFFISKLFKNRKKHSVKTVEALH